jgi:outer membrane protein assembly factor BamB
VYAPCVFRRGFALWRRPPTRAPSAKPPAVGEDWPVWGGKNRDFIVNTSGLADSWPAAGPKRVWSRPLGDGYSSVAEEGGMLYTGFRRNSRDVITALDAATGKTLWEYEYENPFTNDYSGGVWDRARTPCRKWWAIA